MVEDNDNDVAELYANLDPDDILKRYKEELLDYQCYPRKLKIGLNTGDNKFTKLISYMRYIEYEGDKEYLKKLKDDLVKEGESSGIDVYFKAENLKPISYENERKALKRLRALCKDALTDFPGTYEEDVEILKRQDLSFNERNCIIYRCSEKKVLKFNLTLSETAQTWLLGVINFFHFLCRKIM